jgi:hypothetical protein
VTAQRTAGFEHELQASDERLECDVDPDRAGGGEPGVAVGHPERQAGDRLGGDREPGCSDRQLAVLRVRSGRHLVIRVHERHERLTAEVESQPRLLDRPGQFDLRVLEPVHARAVRPPRPERQRLPVERPGVEVQPLAVEPRAQLVDARLEPVEPLRDAERRRHVTARRGMRVAASRRANSVMTG